MHIERGDIYGFVGENGSGKTTVIRLITGLIFPHSGRFSLFGVENTAADIGKARARIGAIVESPSIYLNMSAYDNLKQQCLLLKKDESKILPVLTDVGLEALYSDKKAAGNFSLGMRQRLGIAMVLLGDPEFIILDEPMNGLDPAGIVEIRELILRLNRRGITFLISSHILTELSLVATKYGIISKGRLIKEISAEDLRRECEKTTMLDATDPAALKECICRAFPEHTVKDTPCGVKILGDIDLNAVLKTVLDENITLLSVNCNQVSFEEYYLSLIGGKHHE
jgi:ABC-2 type transport system ATP-binding protein